MMTKPNIHDATKSELAYTETPTSHIELTVSLAPMIKLLGMTEEPTEVKNRFKEARKTIIDEFNNVLNQRTICRLNFILGHILSSNSEASPSIVFKRLVDLVAESEGITLTELPAIPMENGFWALEVAAFLEPTCIHFDLSEDERKKIFLSVIDALNETTHLAQSKTWSLGIEERSKNALSREVSKRMEAALQFSSKNNRREELVDAAILKFNQIIKSYVKLIAEIQFLDDGGSGDGRR